MPQATAAKFDSQELEKFVSRKWDEDIVPRLVEYIRIPCKSPHFDADWAANGHIDAAVTLAEQSVVARSAHTWTENRSRSS
jgi:hypothetical protein